MDKHVISNKELMALLNERLQDNSVLHAKISELSESLFLVNKKLKLSDSYKGHFISNITNEIVNPFASILLLSKNIQSLSDDEMDKAKRMAELINKEAFQLDFQLKNIFAAALIESGKETVSLRKVAVKQLWNKVAAYFHEPLAGKQLQVELSISEAEPMDGFVTDYSKLELILKNLLSNAIKFSHAGDKILVGLKSSPGNLQIEIRDFGKGIPQGERDEIYDRFKQVDERINSVNPGHGLGLSIVKSYCEMLNAEIELAFPDDGGTLILLSLQEGVLEGEDELSDFMLDQGESF